MLHWCACSFSSQKNRHFKWNLNGKCIVSVQSYISTKKCLLHFATLFGLSSSIQNINRQNLIRIGLKMNEKSTMYVNEGKFGPLCSIKKGSS